jgi:hypothetical protein
MKQTTPIAASGVPDVFLSKFRSEVTGFLCGFDRLRFHGTLGMLFKPPIMGLYLSRQGVLLKQFKAFALGLTERVKLAARRTAQAAGRPELYLPSARASKEELAREIARRDHIERGLIAVISTVEPCLSYTVRGNRAAQKLELVLETRKCTHLYHYYMHADFGLMHVRVQTWFPFTIDVCLNGREWLARQMDRAGLRYEKRDNCFVSVSDPARAQALLDEQLRTDWPQLLHGLLEQAHPLHTELSAPLGRDYYWSASQTEFATDVMFRDAASLAAVYPQFLHHGIRTFGSADVLRFLGRVNPNGFRGEVTSTLKRRPEGVRLKHVVNGNSLKLYDKQGSVLRVETTIVNPGDFQVYRPRESDPQHRNQWQIMRRGVADLWRRAEVSGAANARYLAALASTTSAIPLADESAPLCRACTVDGRRHRALNPWSQDDAALLEAISAGEFALNGLRNRDLRTRLFGTAPDATQRRRQSAAITRRLALLRAHKLLKKVTGTHRWILTTHGRRVVTALLAARQASVDQLTKIAA